MTEGGLDVRLRRWLIQGGDSGTAVTPGQHDESLLLERVTSGEMPPGDKPLSDAEVSVLRDWIEQDAPTARPEPESLEDGDYITEEERNFWSFQPIRREAPPTLRDERVLTPVDAFVLARLQQEGLSFSPAADRQTLIRRATFDLWGLPPEPEMVDAFLQDKHPDAYARLIDRLLAAPRYGERWGRHWLDVAGYADSDGYTNDDTEREFAYFYRDYVIDSFNADKPFDQFVCEQLAGDEMQESPSQPLSAAQIERLAATGFLRMAPDGTGSGGVDRAVAANETIADTIEIVSTSLLGLTVGCARCHDHRYDPISQADYYRLRAIFEPALDWKQWKPPSQRRVSLYTDSDRQQRETIEKQAKQAEADRTARQQAHIDRTLEEELLVVPDDQRDALREAYTTAKAKRNETQVALLEEYPSVGNISPGSLYLYSQQRGRRAGDIERAATEREARFVEQAQRQQLANVPVDKRGQLEALLTIPAAERTEAQRQLAAEFPEVFVTSETLADVNPEGFAEVQHYRQAAKRCRELDSKAELDRLQAEISALRSTAPKERFLRVLTEPGGHVPPTHLFVRGDHNQPDKPMPPTELTVLQAAVPTEIAANDPQRPTSGRRLAYARHLTSGKHPLLARVVMNRVWMHHFGHGIVDSPGDFGRLGSMPTHPELLDWLADQWMQGNWNLKGMHRMLMLSHTYQQVSTRSERLDKIDPDNRLYARMSVRRLESEAIRDAMLAVSEALEHRMHGPPVPVKEDAVGQIVIGKEKLDGERKPTGDSTDPAGISRRSVYVQVRRTRPLAVLEAFDIATVSPNCTNRSYSNVATQSLMMMNSQFVIDRADQLAGRLVAEKATLSEQLSAAWLRCFGRPVDPATLSELIDFVEAQRQLIESRDSTQTPATVMQTALATACQAMLSSNEFIYVD